jgi:hypothetical protein
VGKHTKWQKYEAKTKDKGSEIIDTIIPWKILIHSTNSMGAEPLSRGRQLCSYSRTSQYFMEPKGSLL